LLDTAFGTLNRRDQTQVKRQYCIAAILTAAVAALTTGPAAKDNTPGPEIFGATHIEEVYRVLLKRDALLLESIIDVIQQKDIQDGDVWITAGSVQECTFHYVTSTALRAANEYKTVKGPFEILNAGGIIAAGEPHIHITLSGRDKPAFGGHLEKGCRVLYLAEVTIVKYAGPQLTRRNNANGISLLQPKQPLFWK
jgi:predicted DNA-binding protein with PD1-like motif